VDVATSVTASLMASLQEGFFRQRPSFQDVLAFNVTVGGPRRLKKPVDLLSDDVTLQKLAADLPRAEEAVVQPMECPTELPPLLQSDPSMQRPSEANQEPEAAVLVVPEVYLPISEDQGNRLASSLQETPDPGISLADQLEEHLPVPPADQPEQPLIPVATHEAVSPRPSSSQTGRPASGKQHCDTPSDHKATHPALPPPHPSSGRTRSQRDVDPQQKTSALQKLQSLKARRNSSSGSSRALDRSPSLKERRESDGGVTSEKLTGLAALRRLSSSRRRLSSGGSAADERTGKPAGSGPSQRLQQRLSSLSSSRRNSPARGAERLAHVAEKTLPVPHNAHAAAATENPNPSGASPAYSEAPELSPRDSDKAEDALRLVEDVARGLDAGSASVAPQDTAFAALASPHIGGDQASGLLSSRQGSLLPEDGPDTDAQHNAAAEYPNSEGLQQHLIIATDSDGGELNQSFLSGGPEGDNSVLLASPVGSRHYDGPVSLADEAEDSGLIAQGSFPFQCEPGFPAVASSGWTGREMSDEAEYLAESFEEEMEASVVGDCLAEDGPLALPVTINEDDAGVADVSSESPAFLHEQVPTPMATESQELYADHAAVIAPMDDGRQPAVSDNDSVFGEPAGQAASVPEGGIVSSITQEAIAESDEEEEYYDDDFDEVSAGSGQGIQLDSCT